MNIIKNEDKNELILTNKQGDKFLIHYAACDLYFTMLDYYPNNEFIITENDQIFFNLLNHLFDKVDKLNLLNNNCFEWISEAYGLREENNKLTILKDNNKFIIKFIQNPNKKFQRKDICAICFCLSGSKYQEVANYFSLMFYEYVLLDKKKPKILTRSKDVKK